jgi:hypothetical protein
MCNKSPGELGKQLPRTRLKWADILALGFSASQLEESFKSYNTL